MLMISHVFPGTFSVFFFSRCTDVLKKGIDGLIAGREKLGCR